MIKQNLVSFFVKYLEEVGTTLSAEPPDSQYLRKPKNIQILKCNDLRFLDKTVRLINCFSYSTVHFLMSEM